MSNVIHTNSLFCIPVADVLAHFGKRVDHRSYMYYSPFREESSPSMRVTVNPSDGTWIWADYGGSPSAGHKVDGGGILEMVRRLGHCPNDAAVYDILREIAQSKGMDVIEEESRLARKAAAKPSGIVLDDVSVQFTRRNLVRYSSEVRGIPESLLSRYCRQVTYHSRSNVNRHFVCIGFPNNGGGYVLRGTGAPERSKRNYLSGVSTFRPDGVHTPSSEVTDGKCAVFEGFFDFLSYLAWRGVEEPGMDVCVLNSASNVSQARSWIVSHSSVRSFFDNDKAGDLATDTLSMWCKSSGVDYKDGRSAYPSCKDINEAWTAELARRQGCKAGTSVGAGRPLTPKP